ncbi:MAG TPA: S1 RNA-binding domain-containing protein [Clostridiales bacterium]|nr:S1 RNA-binding domain-containing protein [Clostridiales bacterium]
MQLEVGSVLEGKVTGITNFGAFVDLSDGVTGMVHISEVAPTYVNQIRDHLKEGQVVKVKVLSVGDDGKISLSIKKAMDNNGNNGDGPRRNDRGDRNDRGGRNFRNDRGGDRNDRGDRGSSNRRYSRRPDKPAAAPVTSPGNFEWQGNKRSNDASSFEDMMSRFKQTSDEKISDLKRGTDAPARRPRKNIKP